MFATEPNEELSKTMLFFLLSATSANSVYTMTESALLTTICIPLFSVFVA